jgi:hypothetical protein
LKDEGSRCCKTLQKFPGRTFAATASSSAVVASSAMALSAGSHQPVASSYPHQRGLTATLTQPGVVPFQRRPANLSGSFRHCSHIPILHRPPLSNRTMTRTQAIQFASRQRIPLAAIEAMEDVQQLTRAQPDSRGRSEARAHTSSCTCRMTRRSSWTTSALDEFVATSRLLSLSWAGVCRTRLGSAHLHRPAGTIVSAIEQRHALTYQLCSSSRSTR